jgi:Alkaline phosphatase PhoX
MLQQVAAVTEDQDSAGLYRFVPRQPGVLAAGGRLQMLAVQGARLFDGSIGQVRGLRFPVAWIDIKGPDFDVFAQGRARGSARFRRLEGACFGTSSLFFTSTSGGDRGLGQIWQYRARAAGKQRAVRNGTAAWDGDLTPPASKPPNSQAPVSVPTDRPSSSTCKPPAPRWPSGGPWIT